MSFGAALTAEEYRAMLDAAGERRRGLGTHPNAARDVCMLSLMVELGLSAEDVSELRGPQVLTFAEHDRVRRADSGAVDVVELASTRLSRVVERLGRIAREGALFAVTRRRVVQIVSYYGMRAGIPRVVTPHDLRQTYAQRSYRRGESISQIARAIGARTCEGAAQLLVNASDFAAIHR